MNSSQQAQHHQAASVKLASTTEYICQGSRPSMIKHTTRHEDPRDQTSLQKARVPDLSFFPIHKTSQQPLLVSVLTFTLWVLVLSKKTQLSMLKLGHRAILNQPRKRIPNHGTSSQNCESSTSASASSSWHPPLLDTMEAYSMASRP